MKPPSIYDLAPFIPFKSFNINLTIYFWLFSALFLRAQNLIASGKTTLDEARCRNEMQSATNRMLRMHPDVGAIVLGCTNMSPHADTIRCVTGLTAFDAVTLVNHVNSSIASGVLSKPVYDSITIIVKNNEQSRVGPMCRGKHV